MPRQNDNNALIEMWQIVRRYKWRLVLPAFAVTSLVLGVSLFLPRKYKATGIFERRTDMVLTEMANRGRATRNFQDPRDATAEEILGAPAVERLLRKLEPELAERGLVNNRLELDQFRDSLRRRTVVNWDISTYQLDRVRVEYTGDDPQLAAIAVNGLIDSYIQRTKDEMTSRLRESAEFFRNEATLSKAAIEKLEAQALDFEIQYGDLLPENPNNVQTRLVEVKEQHAALIAARDAAATRADALTRAVASVPDTVPTYIHGKNPELTRLEDKLRTAEDELARSLGQLKMTEAHPDIATMRQQIAELKARIAGTETQVVTEKQLQINPKRSELELQLTTALSEQQALTRQAAGMQRELDKMNAAIENMYAVRSTHRKLSRQQEEAQRQLAFWEDNLRQVEMALTADSGNRGVEMSFVKPAHADYRPISPNLAQVFMAAIGLGLLAGGLAVFLAYRTDETFAHGEQMAEHFGIPLFGAVSELITRRHQQLRNMKRFVLYPANALAMAGVIGAIAFALYSDLVEPTPPGNAARPHIDLHASPEN